MTSSKQPSNRESFVEFALQEGVLRFGEFMTKSGRLSPYFFNAGLFNHGVSVGRLGQFYAQALIDAGLQFDMLFGPAYKGIPLATTAAIALSAHPSCASRSVPFAFNRKEAKDHGEGGTLVGAPLHGKVVIIDDVITAGTSVNESVDLIRAAGAEPVAVLIALDRMERAGSEGELSANSAVQDVALRHGMPVVSIATLDDILSVIRDRPEFAQYESAVIAYRDRYGI
ncbi:MAG: orotate phosphoribosyltransferase [Burkholderiaceae bacterium]|nr:orotate phosphoribosyltransferase [Burkholderiaceae bacterium]MCD8517810.1 orotate phosphoribosyltransferase [Burkholderiaceae bacterium]MCD8537232.1 orotate phosphoribosyltransferase [Burkholderiaceae bacterium]MCD8564648.1 orotate phosphoribosyltransferase [Burkholderiaceae bacterium]